MYVSKTPNPTKVNTKLIANIITGVSIIKTIAWNQERSNPNLYMAKLITILIMRLTYHGIGTPNVDKYGKNITSTLDMRTTMKTFKKVLYSFNNFNTKKPMIDVIKEETIMPMTSPIPTIIKLWKGGFIYFFTLRIF